MADEPPVPAHQSRPAWAEQLSHCFAGPNLTWAGTREARWHARETLKAAIDDGATMHDISAAVRTYLQDRGVPPQASQADLDKIRGLIF